VPVPVIDPAPPIESFSWSDSVIFGFSDFTVPKLCADLRICKLCEFIRRTIDQRNGDGQNVDIDRDGSLLRIKHNRKPILRLCLDFSKQF
jgi:hypothetical protein